MGLNELASFEQEICCFRTPLIGIDVKLYILACILYIYLYMFTYDRDGFRDGYDEARFFAVLLLYCERNQYPELFALK